MCMHLCNNAYSILVLHWNFSLQLFHTKTIYDGRAIVSARQFSQHSWYLCAPIFQTFTYHSSEFVKICRSITTSHKIYITSLQQTFLLRILSNSTHIHTNKQFLHIEDQEMPCIHINAPISTRKRIYQSRHIRPLDNKCKFRFPTRLTRRIFLHNL